MANRAPKMSKNFSTRYLWEDRPAALLAADLSLHFVSFFHLVACLVKPEAGKRLDRCLIL